jgi:hypothetical protein
MPRVPITVMGYRCNRCGHGWVPKSATDDSEPVVCPKCKSPYWNRPKRSVIGYDDFRNQIEKTLREAGGSLTWTEIRTKAKLPQMFPNNQWVHRMKKDIGLERKRDVDGIIHWQLKSG